jgi:hypothetical protein
VGTPQHHTQCDPFGRNLERGTTMTARINTRCMVEAEHHSADTVEVWHGHAEPAVGCGFHVFNESSKLFDAHRARMGKAS